jgi:hypothetical protein
MIPTNFKKWNPMYRGAFTYLIEGEEYSNETFQMYTNSDNGDLAFSTESHSRARTGEVLRVQTTQIFAEDFKFKEAEVEKFLGDQYSKENYNYNLASGDFAYTFSDKEKKLHSSNANTSHNFHVQTPDIVTTLLFVVARNLNQGSSINQKVFYAQNNWTYENPIDYKSIIVTRSHKGALEEIVVDKDKMKASEYMIFENEDHEKSREPGLIVYLSKHYGIPYQIIGPDKTKITIDYLNDIREVNIDSLID